MFKPSQFFSELLAQLGGLGFALLLLCISNAQAQQLIFPGPATAIRTSDMINVKLFGAVGNGIADDTLAIQSAINAAPQGGTVFLPASTNATYVISSGLTISKN